MCAEKYLTSLRYPTNIILRRSFQIKLFFIITELMFVILFGAFLFQRVWAPSVVFEWIIGFFYALYMWSCALDFFAVPGESGEKSDMMTLLDEDWDVEVALAVPRRIRPKILHKYYIELP